MLFIFDLKEYFKPGESREINKTVEVEDTVGNHSVHLNQLLSTSACTDIFVQACTELVADRLPEGFITIGYNINITHLAPTLLGTSVSFKARLAEISGNRLYFELSARDGKGKVLDGSFERVVVNRITLMDKAEERAKEIKNSK